MKQYVLAKEKFQKEWIE